MDQVSTRTGLLPVPPTRGRDRAEPTLYILVPLTPSPTAVTSVTDQGQKA
jgi:hypothetical protein